MLGPYDLLVLAVLGVGYFMGRAKGLAWQLSGIATLVLGFVAATAGAKMVAPLFPNAWSQDLKRYAAWTAIYASVSIAIYLLTLALSKKLKQLELDELDRRFGGALGAVKAGLLLAALSLVAVAGSERAREFVQDSTSGLLLAHVGSLARPVLPDKIGRALDRSLERLEPNGPSAPPALPAPANDGSSAPAPVPSRPARPHPSLAPRLNGAGPASPRPAQPARPNRPSPAASPVAPEPPEAPSMDDPDGGDDETPSRPPTRRPKDGDEDEPPSKPEPRDPLAPR